MSQSHCLFVQRVKGATWAYATEDVTVKGLKEHIGDKEGIRPARQRLMFAGKQLEDERTLGSYGVGEGDTLHLVLRVPVSRAALQPRCHPCSPAPSGETQSSSASQGTQAASSTPVSRIFVERPGDVLWGFNISAWTTVMGLKRQIKMKKRVRCDEQRLSFKGSLLEDGRTLQSYKVGHGDSLGLTIVARRRRGERMHINVKTLTGTKLAFEVGSHDTIHSVMCKIQDVEGIPPDQQKLVFAARHLDAERTLDYYGVCEGSVVHLCLRLRGGMLTGESGKFDFYERAVDVDSEVEDAEDDAAAEGAVDPVAFVRSSAPAPSGGRAAPPPAGPHGETRCRTSTAAAAAAAPGTEHFGVVVRDLFGATWAFEVTECCTVESLSVRIKGKDGIPPDQQRLVFNGRQLEDGRTLRSYGVRDGDTLHLREAPYVSSLFSADALRPKDR